jgi:hypothetical protein
MMKRGQVVARTGVMIIEATGTATMIGAGMMTEEVVGAAMTIGEAGVAMTIGEAGASTKIGSVLGTGGAVTGQGSPMIEGEDTATVTQEKFPQVTHA